MEIKIFVFLSVVIFLLYQYGKLKKLEEKLKNKFEENTKNMDGAKKKNMMYFWLACGVIILYITSALIASLLESPECKQARKFHNAGLVNQSMVDILCDGKITGEAK